MMKKNTKKIKRPLQKTRKNIGKKREGGFRPFKPLTN